jgi:hypothetical protein
LRTLALERLDLVRTLLQVAGVDVAESKDLYAAGLESGLHIHHAMSVT